MQSVLRYIAPTTWPVTSLVWVSVCRSPQCRPGLPVGARVVPQCCCDTCVFVCVWVCLCVFVCVCVFVGVFEFVCVCVCVGVALQSVLRYIAPTMWPATSLVWDSVRGSPHCGPGLPVGARVVPQCCCDTGEFVCVSVCLCVCVCVCICVCVCACVLVLLCSQC